MLVFTLKEPASLTQRDTYSHDQRGDTWVSGSDERGATENKLTYR